MNLEEAIAREEALAYSFGERWKRLGEKIEDLPILEEEHRQLAEWLRELKAWRDFGASVGQLLGKYLTEEQIKKLEEVTANEDSR